MPDLPDLLARVEAAEGADRYADCWLACALDGFFPSLTEWNTREEGATWRIDFCCYRNGGLFAPGHGGAQMVEPYTASLDAALALVERCLPGAWIGLQQNRVVERDRAWSAWLEVFPHWASDYETFEGVRPTAPLALIAALLRALIATGQHDTTGASTAPGWIKPLVPKERDDGR